MKQVNGHFDGRNDCWNRIGVRGDRSCPELATVVHCHNCPVFAGAGRQFLNAPCPDDYLAEWTEKLAAPMEEATADLEGVLIFRLAQEWLALPVQVLVEVTLPSRVHRIPHRGGILAGITNIRGELHLCVRLDRLLGIQAPLDGVGDGSAPHEAPRRTSPLPRMLVTRHDHQCWAFPVDEVDQVHRLPLAELTPVPATISRAAAHTTRGVFSWKDRSVGLLDVAKLFQVLQARLPR